jgi:hypothetical protein
MDATIDGASLRYEVSPDINGASDTSTLTSNEYYNIHGHRRQWWHIHPLHQLNHHLLFLKGGKTVGESPTANILRKNVQSLQSFTHHKKLKRSKNIKRTK